MRRFWSRMPGLRFAVNNYNHFTGKNFHGIHCILYRIISFSHTSKQPHRKYNSSAGLFSCKFILLFPLILGQSGTVPQGLIFRRILNMKALITGATSGIGREFAVLLARMGCELILASRKTKKMEQLKRRLPSSYSSNRFTDKPVTSAFSLRIPFS
mgnify:CR=1 FL=1